jgi:hypothetical protein
MHYEMDFGVWDTPEKIAESSSLYIQRGKDGFGKREVLKDKESDMFQAELELFAESCRTGKGNHLSAENANVAVACVNAALRSLDNNSQLVLIADVVASAARNLEERKRNAA